MKKETNYCSCGGPDPECAECGKPVALFSNHAGPRSMSGMPMEHGTTRFKKGRKYYVMELCEAIYEGAASDKGSGRFRLTGEVAPGATGCIVIKPKREAHS